MKKKRVNYYEYYSGESFNDDHDKEYLKYKLIEDAFVNAHAADPDPEPDVTPAKKQLLRELKEKALERLENAARTEQDFQNVIRWWDRNDANRERKERYHEILRSGDDLALDSGAAIDARFFPDHLGYVLEHQQREGDFIETIYNCPFEIDELVTDKNICRILKDLPDQYKEILYLYDIRKYSSQLIGMLKGQSDRNVRKVHKTAVRKINRKLVPMLIEKQERNEPLTSDDRLCLLNAGLLKK